MNTTLPILHPGHCLCCCNCRHRLPDASHVSPCSLVKWEGTRHVKPALVDNWGLVECGDFQAAEPAPAAWATEPAPEPTQGDGGV